MLKALKYGLILLATVLGLLVYMGWASDIPHDILAEKYAIGASDFIDLPSGTRAHYRIQGNDQGRTLVLLHGSNASLQTWEPWVGALEDDYLVITVDLPGHGLTGDTPADDYTYAGMSDFLHEFTGALGLKHFTLGGNSMGGGVSLLYALTYPEQLESLILLDSAGIKVPERAAKKQDQPIAFKLAGHWYSDWILESITPRSMVTDGLKKGFTDHSLITDKMIDRYWELIRHPGNRRSTAMRFAYYREQRGELPIEQIKLPTLILWGADDKIIPLAVGEEMEKRIVGSKLVVFAGVGHAPMEETPEKSAAAVGAFFAALEVDKQ